MSKIPNKGRSTHVERVKEIILAAITDEPLGEMAISYKTGLSTRSIREYVREMYADKRLHVGDWSDMTGSKRHRMYLAGEGEDKPYPPKLAQQTKRDRVKKSGPPASDKEIESEPDWVPLRKCRIPVRIQRDWLVSAFFGEYQPTSNSNSSAEGWPQITLRVIGEYQGARA